MGDFSHLLVIANLFVLPKEKDVSKNIFVADCLKMNYILHEINF